VFLTGFSGTLLQYCILTDDPMRAKILVAHHLEYAEPVYENGDVFIYNGSYNGSGISLISAGSTPPPSCVKELKSLGVSGLLYIGDCSSIRHPLRTVILNGDSALLDRAKKEASQIDVPITICDNFTAPYAAELHEQANQYGLSALSILTVSKNLRTNEETENNPRTRLYPAATLAFELLGSHPHPQPEQ